MIKILAAFSLSVAFLYAGNIEVGTPLYKLNSYKYESPQGRNMRIPKKTKLVIVAYEKDTGKLVNEFLATKNKFYLQKNRSIFIADIHEMPSIITTMFALPKLQKYKHLIYLHYGEKFSQVTPSKSEQITLLHVINGKIDKVSFISTAKELQENIEK